MVDARSPDPADFHLAEYNALRAEMLLKISSNDDLERQSLLATAAVYAWVFTRPDLDQEFRATILFLPFLLNFFNWLRAEAVGRQIGMLGRYIAALERQYGGGIELSVRPGTPEDIARGWEHARNTLGLDEDDGWIYRNFLNMAHHSKNRWRVYCSATLIYSIYQFARIVMPAD